MICNFCVTIVSVLLVGARKSIKMDLSWTSWGTRHLNSTYNSQEDHYLRSTYIVYCITCRRCKQRSSVAALACADHRGARIWGFNKVLVLQLTRQWLMTRMDWSTLTMFQGYFDSRISVTAASEWGFAPLRFSLISGPPAPSWLPFAPSRNVHATVYRGETLQEIVSGCNAL